MQQLFDDVYMLEGEVGGRPLQLVYLRGDHASLLMDTGCANDPSTFVEQQIKQAGGKASELTWILNTHPDLDHIGGNHQMKEIAPQSILACGEKDLHVCRDFDSLMRYRYDVYRDDHNIFYDGPVLDWLRAEGGLGHPIDVTFCGGEQIRLSADWNVRLVATPGHADGHLAVHDTKNHALYGADAIHGVGYKGIDGKMKLCPTYADVVKYLETITLIENLPISTYVGCHWPLMKDKEVGAFCDESRSFVRQVDALLLQELASPHSLRELCERLGPELGEWPRRTDIELVYAISGHLSKLEREGQVFSRRRKIEPSIVEYLLS